MAQRRSETKAAAEKKARLQALSKGPDLERLLDGKKRKFVTYAQGAKIYSLNYYSFVKLAKAAKANIQIKKNVVIDLEMVEEYLEKHCETEDEEDV